LLPRLLQDIRDLSAKRVKKRGNHPDQDERRPHFDDPQRHDGDRETDNNPTTTMTSEGSEEVAAKPHRKPRCMC